MKRKLTLMLTFLFVWMGVAWSQGLTVKGVVTSEEDGLPIVGASVLVKGTTQGTITDVDGNFEISGVKAGSKTLIVSFVGMKSQEVAIKPNMKIVLQSDTETLDEVVVTAMGISREKKALGYALQEVKSDEITQAAPLNVANALSGKIAGIQITSQGGQVGASQNIVIRGNSSLETMHL